jgi:hypothetical protein
MKYLRIFEIHIFNENNKIMYEYHQLITSILNRLDIDLEFIITNIDTFKFAEYDWGLLFENPVISYNVALEHNDIFNVTNKLIYLVQNPSLTYEQLISLCDISMLNTDCMDLLMSNQFEFDEQMIFLNKLIKQNQIHSNRVIILLGDYFPSVLCRIIMNYEFYR